MHLHHVCLFRCCAVCVCTTHVCALARDRDCRVSTGLYSVHHACGCLPASSTWFCVCPQDVQPARHVATHAPSASLGSHPAPSHDRVTPSQSEQMRRAREHLCLDPSAYFLQQSMRCREGLSGARCRIAVVLLATFRCWSVHMCGCGCVDQSPSHGMAWLFSGVNLQ